MAFKSQYSMSRDAFDGLLTVIGSLLPDDHVLPKSMYEAQKLLHALKMTYEQIHSCPKGRVLFRKEYAEAKYFPKCKSFRFMEVDSGDGLKRQLDIPLTEDPASVHDRGIRETDDMAQKWKTIQS
jgi:hypothetical protein